MAPITRRNNRVATKPPARQPIPKNVMTELSIKHNKACMLCGKKDISEKLYGLMYQLNDVIVHCYCILLSSNAVQNGADNEGIWGFLLKDIKAELVRGSKEICVYCNKKGATISCCGVKCRKVFHLPCGLKNGSMHQYFLSFKSFCQEHRIPQIIDSSELQNSTPSQCAICKDAVTRSRSPNSIWAPCCKHNAWFHRECIQDLALSAGYFFKCPLCNDVEKFKPRMLTLGIYIPSRDASWETVPNAFAELSERQIICSIETCLCPHEEKRKFQHAFGSWEILPCNFCGSNGTHRLCSSIKIGKDWYCTVCKGVKDKNEINKNKIQLELLDNGNCSSSSTMFEEKVPSCNRNVSQRLNNEIMHNEDQPHNIIDSNDSDHCSIQSISDDESSNTHDIDPQNTHLQVEQMPQIRLPRISSYGSVSSGYFRNLLNRCSPLPTNQPMSIDLTSDDDDD
ncbi:hypothetical protein ACI65C_006850 [Semiaphis heraclei]